MLGFLARIGIAAAALVGLVWLACDPGAPEPASVEASFEQRHPNGFHSEATDRLRAAAAEYVRDNAHRAGELGALGGLDTDEHVELTYLGLLAEATQNAERIEHVLGHPPSIEVRRRAAHALDVADSWVRQNLQELVARGATKSERAQVLRRGESLYIVGYCEALGIGESDLL